MDEPSFESILKSKRDYYGYTEAAISFAAEEYARQYLSFHMKDINQLAHDGLPDDCIKGWSEYKFCENRQGDGNQCKHCSHYI